jgi:hypothetical protein
MHETEARDRSGNVHEDRRTGIPEYHEKPESWLSHYRRRRAARRELQADRRAQHRSAMRPDRRRSSLIAWVTILSSFALSTASGVGSGHPVFAMFCGVGLVTSLVFCVRFLRDR